MNGVYKSYLIELREMDKELSEIIELINEIDKKKMFIEAFISGSSVPPIPEQSFVIEDQIDNKYEDDLLEDEPKSEIEMTVDDSDNKQFNHNRRGIIAKDGNGKLLNIFESISETRNFFNISNWSVYNAVDKNKPISMYNQDYYLYYDN